MTTAKERVCPDCGKAIKVDEKVLWIGDKNVCMACSGNNIRLWTDSQGAWYTDEQVQNVLNEIRREMAYDEKMQAHKAMGGMYRSLVTIRNKRKRNEEFEIFPDCYAPGYYWYKANNGNMLMTNPKVGWERIESLEG
jgi:hypothetical protein